MTEQDILNLIEQDEWMMDVLRTAEKLNLPDWVIGAGFVRNKVWDHLHGFENTPLEDIDLVYFDKSNISEEKEKEYDKMLKEKLDAPWSTKNHARIHLVCNTKPYKSTFDGLSRWPETATGIGVKLEKKELKLITPNGIEDLVNLTLRSAPRFVSELKIIKDRIKKKEWLKKWPKLKVADELSSYLITIDPPKNITKIIDKYREKFAKYTKYKIPPHVTIYPPFYLKVDEKELVTLLERQLKGSRKFSLDFDSIDYFVGNNNVAYFSPSDKSKEKLEVIFTKTFDILENRIEDVHGNYKTQGFKPHITIAEQIPNKDFEDIQKELADIKEVFSFMCNSILIYKQDYKSRIWKKVKEITF